MNRWPFILLAASLLGATAGCVSSNTTLETTAVRPLGRIATGPPRGETTVRAIAWQEGSTTVVRVQRVLQCPSAEVKEVSRDEVSRSRISTAAIVGSAVLGGLGAVELITSDKQNGDDKTVPGLLMIATGGLILGVAKGIESDTRKHLPAERVYELSTPLACKSVAWAGAEVIVGSGPDALTAQTGPDGEARLEGLVLRDRPSVQVDGHEVGDVVVVRSRDAAERSTQRATSVTAPKPVAVAKPKPTAVSRQLPPPPVGVPGLVPTGAIQDLPPPPPPPAQ
jgi:hypothetical protein